MDLRSVVAHLEAVAPSSRAEDWDNVGLLVEPSGNPTVHSLLLTIDLTEEVLHEAVNLRTELIVSYHPPIFRPLKRLTQLTAKERIVVQTLEHKMAIYSPHTALDGMEGGVNDWLLAGLGDGQVSALGIHLQQQSQDKMLTIHGLAEEQVATLDLPPAQVAIRPSLRLDIAMQ